MGVVKLQKYSSIERNIEAFKMYTVKDFLFFFNIDVSDVSKLIEFADQIKKNKQFVLKHRKQFYSLTEREKEIFKLVVEGKKSSEIATSLFIQTATVATHRKKIKQKLNLKSNYDWYKYAKAFDILKTF